MEVGNKIPGEIYFTMTCKLNALGICVRGKNKLGETRTPVTPGAGFSFIFRSATDSSYMAWNFNHTNSRDMCVSKAFRITRVATICMVKIPCHIRRSYIVSRIVLNDHASTSGWHTFMIHRDGAAERSKLLIHTV